MKNKKRKYLVSMFRQQFNLSLSINNKEARKFFMDKNLNVPITKKDKEFLHKILDHESNFNNDDAEHKYMHKFVDNLPSNLNKFLKYRGNISAIYKRSRKIPTMLRTVLAVLL